MLSSFLGAFGLKIDEGSSKTIGGSGLFSEYLNPRTTAMLLLVDELEEKSRHTQGYGSSTTGDDDDDW